MVRGGQTEVEQKERETSTYIEEEEAEDQDKNRLEVTQDLVGERRGLTNNVIVTNVDTDGKETRNNWERWEVRKDEDDGGRDKVDLLIRTTQPVVKLKWDKAWTSSKSGHKISIP